MTFIEVTRVIDIFDHYQTISTAIHIIIDPVHINGRLVFDARIGATVTCIVKDYLEATGEHTLIMFICDSKDGKQLKRDGKFDRWFKDYKADTDFEKYDQEILEPNDDGTYVSTFISLMFKAGHSRKENILNELEQLKTEIGIDKLGPDGNI